jgi:hypothetical protein
MPYVMVPVPEEYVTEVMQLVVDMTRQGRAEPDPAGQGTEAWDDAAVEKLVVEVDEPSRSLLSVVAHGALADTDVTDQTAADFMQLSMRDITRLLGQIDDECKRAGRPPLISTTQVSEALPSGHTREKRVLTMPADAARVIRAAERGAEGSEPSALGSGGG